MRHRTLKNIINTVIGTTPFELLGPNPKRKSFMLAPFAGPSSVVIEVFLASDVTQNWTVPPGVTQVVDMLAWGPGGPGNSGDPLTGGGGGGSGGYSTLGATNVTPGTVWALHVGAGSSGEDTSARDPSTALVLAAPCGQPAPGAAGGAGGSGGVGATVQDGEDGATTAVADGGGGGGAPGNGASGNPGTVSAGGAGAGTVIYGAYGVGGNGGNGGVDDGPPSAATAPGGGGGGKALVSVEPATDGADGVLVIVYIQPEILTCNLGAISLSQRADVAPGLGSLNWKPCWPFPLIVTDNEIGTSIGDPWWVVSAIADVPIQITEYLYELPVEEENIYE